MDRALIHWNIVNWITITLMAAVGYLVIAVAVNIVMGGLNKNPLATDTGI